MTGPATSERWSRPGLAFAIGSHVLWGLLPGYFLLLLPSHPLEIVAFRILCSLAVCALLVTAVRGWRRLLALLCDRRTVLLLVLAAVFIYGNWFTYVMAVVTGHLVEGALGYFANPLLTALLGVVVLRERLRGLQWIALGITGVAVLVLSIGYGSVPWFALVISCSFGCYGLVKNRLGPKVDAIGGLTIETAILAPVAAVQVAVLASIGMLEFGRAGAAHMGFMLLTGVLTSVPLLLFAAGARRLPLVAIGLTQFVGPVIQFVFGVVVLREDMPFERWIGFGLVWIALVILAADMIAESARSRRRAGPEAAGTADGGADASAERAPRLPGPDPVAG